jgi:hypothetical protein
MDTDEHGFPQKNLSVTIRRQLYFPRLDLCDNQRAMSEPDDDLPKPTYKWPWFVLAAFLTAVVLAVLWMSYAVRREKQERDFNAPLPSSAPR